MFKKITEAIKRKPSIGWGIFALVMVGVFLLGLLAASVTEKRAEVATLLSNKTIEIKGLGGSTINPYSDLWGKNYPREYDTWKQTAETDYSSKHMGNSWEDILESRPEMVVMWAGYPFSREYNAPRGHMHAMEDMISSLRTGTPTDDNHTGIMQPGTCWTCKGPDVPRLMHEHGVAEFYNAHWYEFGEDFTLNPVGCADCHNPETMELIITRPGLIEAFQRQGKNIEDATHQEMRSLVCAQCHVEYYFGPGRYLNFPWDKGFTVEQIETHLDSVNHVDWVHAVSGAPMLKAQHPDYELFLMGPHAQRDVSCADCHMPYKAEGGVKYSSHHVMSPLKNISNTCQTCHRDNEEDLLKYVYEYQDKAIELRNQIEKVITKTHIMAKYARESGATDAQLKAGLQLIRQAQWRWDFIVASHGASFHAPVETHRVFAHSLDKARQAEMELQKVLFAVGAKDNIPNPDISSKAKAQEYIGLDMKKLEEAKEVWMKELPVEWEKNAKKKKEDYMATLNLQVK